METTDERAALNALLENDPGLPNPNPTEAFWQSIPHSLANVHSSSLPTSADIVVIGSGITGCSVAKALLEKTTDTHVVVLEARSITSGATGRNGGHLTSAAVGDYPQLVQHFGKPMAKKIARFTFRNVERVFELSKSFGEEVKRESEARKVEGVVAFLDESVQDFASGLSLFEEDNPDLKGRYQILNASETSEKYGIPNTKGSFLGPAGAIWPYRLVTNVFNELLKAHGGRLSIETSTPVQSITKDASNGLPFAITTPHGVIRCHKIVHCTNGHAGHLLPALRGGLFPLRGNMSVQKCGTSFPNVGAERSWSFHHHPRVDPTTGAMAPGLYYITQNEHTSDIFIGGEKEILQELLVSDDSRLGPNSSANLKTLLPELFGDKGWAATPDRVRSMWSGIMGFTADGMPLVGRVPSLVSGRGEKGDEFIAAGFNGYGMANAWLCGEAVVAMMLGEDVSDWLPEAFILTPERMEHLNPQMAIQRLFGM